MRPWATTRGRLALAGAAALLLMVTALAVTLPRPGPAPEALEPDLPPLTADGEIRDIDLAHDSRDDLYRAPYGAVPAGTVVSLRLRAAAGDLTQATVRVYDTRAESQVLIPMEVVARDGRGGEHGYDYWQVDLPTINLPTVLYYRFIVADGSAVRYLEDDDALDGGPGTIRVESADASWQLVTYQPDFATPEWAAGATIYQVFPDRFANGDASNDPSPDATPDEEGAGRYRHGDVYGNPVLPKGWDELPEGHCRSYQGAGEPCDEEPLGRDFFGGDLAGLTQHVDDLAEMGVTVLYLNPIFAAPSNHRYDTSDYLEIDPDLGTREEFDAFVEAAHDAGLRVVLDGVFNHTSSDSPLFDRAGRYPEVGACESADSPWATWYTLEPGPPAKCFDGQTYEDWFGFDTLAVLTEDPEVFAFVNGDDGVVRHWLEAGIDGWRLDVMNEISHPFLRGLRRAVKKTNPEAMVLGEEWNDASAWLLGNEADGVMNYRFRRAVIGLVNGDTADLDGAIPALMPSAFASAMEGVREDYPAPAWNALLNLVDSHDTTRILWTLTPGADNRGAKEDPEALAAGKAKLRQVAALQLTWPGMASIYYGTEAGLTGHDDPDDRRPYPWEAVDTELRAHYTTLVTLRRDSDALRSGDLRFLLADDRAGVLAYLRRTDTQAAVVVLNLSDQERSVEVPLAGAVPDGLTWTDGLTGEAHGPGASLSMTLSPRGSAVLLTEPGTDLAPPAAPADPTAEAEGGVVSLAWAPIEDAAAYTVWRSIVSGGGYVAVGTTDVTTFRDETARPGTRYWYVITASDAAGNAGPRSVEVSALPQVVVADARLDAPERVSQPLSAVEPAAEIAALVRVEGGMRVEGPTVGVLVEIGFGPRTADPSSEAWTWNPMRHAGDVGDDDRYVGSVRPEAPGEHLVAVRLSTDGGASWRVADRDGLGYDPGQAVRLTPVATDDTEPPPAISGLVPAVVSDSLVRLGWEPAASDDLLRYEVLRREPGSDEYLRIGVSTDPAFSDEAVRAGQAYSYVVVAVDDAYNRSEPSVPLEATAQSRQVQVTFRVSVPAYTPETEAIYIAGDFQGWDPGLTPMQREDATTWTISLPFPEGARPQYKFTRGSWESVEKDSACGEIPNRSALVAYGQDGTQLLEHEVGKWRDLDACD